MNFNTTNHSFQNWGNGFFAKGFQSAKSTASDTVLADSTSPETARQRTPAAGSLLSDEYIASRLATEATDDSSTLEIGKKSGEETSSRGNFWSRAGSANTSAKRSTVDLSSFVSKFRANQGGAVGEAAKMMEDISHDIEKKIYQGIISRAVESKGVKLGTGDVLAVSVDGTGNITLNAEASKIAGYVSKPSNPDAVDPNGKYIEDICGAIAADLNKETVDGSSFGDALLKHYAKEMGYDYEAIKGDESFSISFSFRYNDQSGTHEMMDAKLVNRMSEEIVALSTDAASKLAERKAKREEKEAMRAAALAAEEAGNEENVAVTESENVTETEDESGTPRSGEVSLEEFEQTYQDRYVKPNVRYGKVNLIEPPQQPLFKREGDRLVPADPNMTFEEALAKSDEYQRYIRGELFTEIPPEDVDERVGVLKVMYNDFSFDMIGADGLEACALIGWQLQDVNGDAHLAQAYRDRIDGQRAELDQRIADKLAANGLEMADGETLDFDVDLDGRITLTGGIADTEKAAAIEAALNEDETLGRELLLNHVRQDMGHRRHSGSDFTVDPVNSRIIAAEVLRNETGLSLDDIEFDEKTVTFKDKNGNVDLTAVSKDYMVWHGLYNGFAWNGEAYEAAEPMAVSFRYGDVSNV